jgi:structural maintenance of chromosomes protein 5
LKMHSGDTAQAWDWIQKHMDQFEKPVYGPPIVECSIKDRRYIDAMESLFQKSDLLSITAQTRADFAKLSDLLYGNLGLADINIKCQTTSLAQEMQRRPNISEQQMKQCGLDGWASDFIEGPEPVIAMLCSSVNLPSVGISLQDINEAQYNLIMETRISTWASGRQVYRTTRRAEYGSGATSTTTRLIGRAKIWTDQPVDVSARRQVEQKIEVLTEEFEALKVEALAWRARSETLKVERTDLMSEIVCLHHTTRLQPVTNFCKADLKAEKNRLQAAAGAHAALPAKISKFTHSCLGH